jgi:hypothetical protein
VLCGDAVEVTKELVQMYNHLSFSSFPFFYFIPSLFLFDSFSPFPNQLRCANENDVERETSEEEKARDYIGPPNLTKIDFSPTCLSFSFLNGEDVTSVNGGSAGSGTGGGAVSAVFFSGYR